MFMSMLDHVCVHTGVCTSVLVCGSWMRMGMGCVCRYVKAHVSVSDYIYAKQFFSLFSDSFGSSGRIVTLFW